MGLPLNAEIDGRYVISHEFIGVNSRITVTRIADSAEQNLIMKQEWLSFIDGLCQTQIDHQVLGMLCDTLFL